MVVTEATECITGVLIASVVVQSERSVTLVCADVKVATSRVMVLVGMTLTRSTEGIICSYVIHYYTMFYIVIYVYYNTLLNIFSSLTCNFSFKRSWSNRLSPNYNPFVSCTGHSECIKIDMNAICSTKTDENTNTRKCECREDMRWNNETLECQVN